MDFGFSKEEKSVIEDVRAFIKEKATPAVIKETRKNEKIFGGPEGRKFIKEFAANGWLVPNWPKKYGGLGASNMIAYMIRYEMTYMGVPAYFVGAHMAGPVILRFGSEEMKDECLLPIARGEVEYCLGYTEPQAGSDLSSVAMRAEDKGDHFLINGQKTFNTSAHLAEYHWLIARTDVNGPPHKGMSLFVVDLKSPGITISPLITMAGLRTNQVFYEDVVVPKTALVGEQNKGFYYLMSALDFERMFPPSGYTKIFDYAVEYAKKTMVNGKPLSKDPLVQQKLAQIAIELEVVKLLYYQLPYMLDNGMIPNYQSSMEKMFATELAQRVTNIATEILGLYGQLREGSKFAPFNGEIEQYYRMSVVETIYGGTSEIQRNIIALRGLGLPRK